MKYSLGVEVGSGLWKKNEKGKRELNSKGVISREAFLAMAILGSSPILRVVRRLRKLLKFWLVTLVL